MPNSPSRPSAIFSFTPDHEPTIAALSGLCEAAGLRVYLVNALDPQPLRVFEQVRRDGARPCLAVHGGGSLATRSASDCTLLELESAWQSICHAGSLFGQAAIGQMKPSASGTLLYLGHVGATQIRPMDAAHASAQAGLRSFAQSMARAFGPKGIHVVYAKVASTPSSKLDKGLADGLAHACWQLHLQRPSCWTHEVDLRPAHLAVAHGDQLA